MLKATVSHNARNGCERCHVKGEYTENRIIFRDINAVERTHDLFVQKLIKYKKLPMPSNPLRFDNVLKYLICNVLSF